MQQIQSPNSIKSVEGPVVFLAGSIEMGKAVDWQKDVVEKMSSFKGTLLNPRRTDWDSSWVQSVENTEFKRQVNWELDGLEASDYILFHIDPKTLSPITFGEFCAFYKKGNIIISCPKGWWRRGNIEVMCDRAGIKLFDNLSDAINELIIKINGEGNDKPTEKEISKE